MKNLKIHTFAEISAEKIHWLWEPYIAFGKITVVQGDPGNGKTTLALSIASLISRRMKMPTGDTEAFIGNVIYQSGEDNPQDTIKPRLVACGADCSRIAFIEEDASLSLNMLEEAIVETNSLLVVLDPLQAFLTEKQDISSAKNMRPILRDLGNIAARTGAAIIIIMNKVERSKGIYRGLGSIDITAAARSVLLIGKRKDDPNTRFMMQIKNNLSTFGKAVGFCISDSGRVEFLGESNISEDDLLSDTPSKPSKFELAKQIITDLLADGDKKSNDVYDACINAGISSSTMQLVKKRLGIKSVAKIDDWYWTMNGVAEDGKIDELTDSETEIDVDETPVVFLDNCEVRSTYVSPLEQPFLADDIVPHSPYGELVAIDWRACV